ncbi:MAG: OmpA family protein [Gammaproteobacteria bacterium]
MRRLLLLIGLIALALLLYFCTRDHAPKIEADIAERTLANLSAEGIEWSNVSADGRNIILQGVAPSEADRNMATQVAQGVYGVSQVDNQMTLAGEALLGESAPTGNLSAAVATGLSTQFSFMDRKLVLSGSVPDEATKKELVDFASSNFRSAEIVDELIVSPSPMLAGWKDTALVSLSQLGEFSTGKVMIEDDRISLEGMVDSQTSGEYVRQAMDKALNGQFTASYVIDVEQFEPLVTEPVVEQAASDVAEVTAEVVADCQSRFNEILGSQTIRFNTDKAGVSQQSHQLLDSLANIASSCPDTHIEIAGYTDSKGSESYNQKLSQKRAEAVLEYLIGQNVRADRLIAIGYGEEQPVADNSTEAGRAQNRRIEFTVKGN